MAKSLNKVFEMGRLTRDVDYRVAQNGKKVARFTLAVDSYGEETDFFDFVAFENSADFASKYLAKGRKVVVEGRLKTSKYPNAEGVEIKTTDIVVENIFFAEPKKSTESTGFDQINAPIGVEELPFE